MTSYILLFSASLVGPLAGLSAPLLRLHTVGSGRGGSAADADAARDAIANYWHAVDNSDVNNATTILILRTDPAIRLSESDQAELLSLLEQLRSSPLLIVDNGDAAVEAEGFLASLQIPYKRGFLPPSFYALAVNHHSALAAVLSDINSEDRLLVPQLFASAGSAYRKKAPPAPPKEESTKEEADDEDSDEDGAVVEESEEDDDEEEDEVPKAKAPANKRPVMGDSHEDEDEDEEETPKKTIPSKAASQKKPSEDSNEEDDDSAEVIKRPKNRLPCKYRKSCYESGRLPEVLNPVVEKKDVDDDEDDDEEEGGEKARTDDSKLGCKYRKSCYETGKLPKVLNPVMEPTESDEESSEEAIDANPYASGKLRCKYRKSCYSEEGIEDKSAPSEVEDSDGTEKGHKKHHHHQTQQAHGKGVKKPRTIKDIAARALKKAEEEEARAKSEYRPSTASKASEKMAEIGEKLAAKLDCKYRKSCYESGNLPEIDSYSFALPTVPYLSSYISGDKDGDGEPDEEEEEPVDFAEMKESQQKFHCRYRKSCYETGERPAAAVYEPMAFVDYFTLPESSESRIVVSKELGCKYRKSCYESGEVPVIESTLPDLAAFIPSFFSGGSGSAHPQEKVVQIEADAESVRNFCKYRKSCYESIATAEESGDRLSEIVEERKEEKRRARKKGHSKANDDPREKEVKKTRKEKEAVKVEVKKQEAPKKKEEKKPEPVKETKKTFKPVAAKVVEDVVEEVMVKKIVKQAEPKKKAAPPPPPPAKVEESEESKEEDEEEEEEKAEKITPKKTAWKPVAKVVPKIEEPEVSEEDVEEPAKKQPASKLHYKKTGKTAVPPPKEDEIVEDEDENMPTSVQGQRDFCKYRKSCYDSGKKPVIESSHSSIFAAIIETAEREYAAQETASKNVHLSAGSDPRLACKYRKSCYENGELPEQLHPVHHIHPEAASSKEVHISAGSNPKLACKYRTSCYETGELPAQLHPVVVDHDDDDEEEDDEEERSAVDGSKLACKYRKSCYETGKLPKVLHPTLAASPVDDDEDDDSREIEDDSGPRRLAEKKKLRCKYRSSCYKSGKLPKVLNPVVVVDHDEDDEVEQRHLSKADSKLKCKYRKSCYGDEEDDDKEEEEEKKEKKASKTHAKPAAPVPKVHVKFEHKKRAERAHHKTHVPAPESNEVEGDEDEEEEVKKEEIKPTKEEPVEKPAVKIQPKVEVEEKDEKSDEVEDDKDVSTEEEEEKEEVKVVPVPIKKPHAQKKIVEEESAKKVDAPKAVEIHAHELGNKSHFTAGQKLDCKYRTSCYAGIPEKKVEETAKAPEAAGQRVPTTPVERPGRCHKYLLSCREFLGLPPKEKVPTGPHGRKLCRRKKDE